jgi:hypothetical protein
VNATQQRNKYATMKDHTVQAALIVKIKSTIASERKVATIGAARTAAQVATNRSSAHAHQERFGTARNVQHHSAQQRTCMTPPHVFANQQEDKQSTAQSISK